jgi:hypothetical protein
MSMSLTFEAQNFIEKIREFKKALSNSEVIFEERSGDNILQGQDYLIAYEASFQPLNSRSLYLEFGVTPDGACAIGVGRFGELAKRLGVGCYNEGRFIGGNEPKALAASDIAWLFDAVRCGKLQGIFRTLPFLGLVSAHICVPQGESKSVPVAFDWIKLCPRFGKRLFYDPWVKQFQS